MATTYDPKVHELVEHFYPKGPATLLHSLACDLQQLIEDFGSQHGACDYCGALQGEHVQTCSLSPDYDPTPWCTGCGAMRKADCHCGPIADND